MLDLGAIAEMAATLPAFMHEVIESRGKLGEEKRAHGHRA